MISRKFAPVRASGFTLIELMVVVTIAGILAAIALPSYNSYIQRSRIVDATSSLADFRVKMEQYYMDNRRYTTAGGKCGIVDPVATGSDSFGLACKAADDRTYTVTADGLTAKNMSGFTYTIDQNGRKKTTGMPAGWSGSGTDGCWVTRKDGSCT